MGSSSTRKPNDTSRINKPANPKTNTSLAGGAGGGPNTPPDINNLCPVRFRIKLTQTNLEMGTKLVLNETTRVLTTLSGENVGKVTARTTKRIESCAKLSIVYSIITVVVNQGACYAEFSQ